MAEMRRKDRLMHEAECLELLDSCGVGRLGLTLDGRRPYVVPINFARNGRRLYLHSAREGAKIEAIRANPLACFEVDEDGGIVRGQTACEHSYLYRSVIMFCTARIIDDIDQKVRALELLTAKYAPDTVGTVSKKAAAGTLVIELQIDEMSGKKHTRS